jgi:hypothetical protein
MKTDKTTVFDLFENRRRYVVPLFQRGYVWTRDAQWQPLWEDLLNQAAEVVRHQSQHWTKLHKHFLGALVLNQTPVALSQVPVVEIIDGQQRLTTLQILLCALRDHLKPFIDPFVSESLQRLTANSGSLSLPDERFKVWPTSAMQTHIRHVMEKGSAAELEDFYRQFHQFKYRRWTPPRPPVVEAYLYFAQAIEEYLDDDPEELPHELVELSATERAQYLVEALIRQFQLVTIELDVEDDAQVIFETLNARGEPLTPSDLVRNFIFLTATRENQDVTRLYNQYWADYEDEPAGPAFWKQEERQGRLKRSRLDLFLFHYVAFRTAEESKIGHLYQAFRDWWESKTERNLEWELQELQKYSGVYAMMLRPDSNTPIGRSFHRLRILDTTTAYPLLLWAAGELGVESAEFLDIARAVESFIVRRVVCGYNQKAYNRFFLEMLGRLSKDGQPPSARSIRAALSASSADSALWPRDDAFRAQLMTAPLYKSIGPRRTEMVLHALEQALKHPFSEDVTINSPLTVEHVLPQNPAEDDWPLYLKDGQEWSDEWLRRTNVVCHQLGNLTLLTQPLNSAVSNGPYRNKRAEIAVSSLHLNKYFQTCEQWDEDSIQARSVKLADLALRVWTGPD